jgi:hypothetical protein
MLHPFYTAYLHVLHHQCLQIKIYCCKASCTTTDTTLHEADNIFSCISLNTYNIKKFLLCLHDTGRPQLRLRDQHTLQEDGTDHA